MAKVKSQKEDSARGDWALIHCLVDIFLNPPDMGVLLVEWLKQVHGTLSTQYNNTGLHVCNGKQNVYQDHNSVYSSAYSSKHLVKQIG